MSNITRRKALRQTTLAAVTLALASPPSRPSARAADAAAGGPFTLPPLPYPADALEPHLDAQTMQLHHDKHHQAYVTNLNKAVAGHPELEQKTVDDLLRNLSAVPESVRQAVRNHCGGHANHTLFWQILKKNEGGKPTGELAKAIDAKWGSLDGFKTDLTKTAVTLFGSGWAWLAFEGGHLTIAQTPNQDSLLSRGAVPLLGIDVWEHAYYLKYQNRRPEYVAAFFNVINWDAVSERYTKLV